jgi:RNA polymerase primary sigma factor
MSARSAHAREEELLDIYWKEIRDNRPLTREEEVELFGRLREGDESARERIIEANLRFVVRIANEYARAEGPSVLELVAEGNLGLMTAIRRFDETRGFKFITYAVWWIRRAIHQAIANQRHSLRTPLNRLEDARLLEREADQLDQSLGRSATFDEVLESTGVSRERALNALEARERGLSLDAPLKSDGEATLYSTLASPTVADPQQDEEAMLEAVSACLDELDGRESAILRAYYGLDTDEPKTLEQIGEEMGVTRERIRQLRNRALERLRTQYADRLTPWSAN